MASNTKLTVAQGESFVLPVTLYVDNGSGTLVPRDITDLNFTGSVKETFSSDLVSSEFTFDKLSPLSSGSIEVKLTKEQTTNMIARDYVYSIFVYSGSAHSRILLEGQFKVRPSTMGS